jgi:NADH-quinone oxidoreductase subunit G
MSGRSSSAILAEVSGGLTEGVLRLFYHRKLGKDADKQTYKKLRSSGNFREATVQIGEVEIKAAVIDGLTGLERLWAAQASGTKYDLVEVMTCQGGCIHGAGLPFIASKDDLKSRAKLIYQADDTEAITLPSKSPSLINLYEKLLEENKDISDKDIFYTHFEKRNVLL